MSLFKYRDYYNGTGRYEFSIANSVEEVLPVKPVSIPEFFTMQKNLVDEFPIDLWRKIYERFNICNNTCL